MENKKFQNLIALIAKITPDSGFFARSKSEILSTPQSARGFSFPIRIFEGITPRTAFAFASIFLVVIISGASYLSSSSSQLASSLNDTALVKEATQATFEIQIAEAAYFDESADKVALALDKIAGVSSEN
ncbi:MAG: hypothetical protein COU10_02505 [Candidatus Harrisonbacteria bacterium CG10_big_fil_rev_8_21_14_0_10_45_28]|uniref:Uncharacterized protein n=1 Tax=Candidatus Harrisonbacteria bacterium CG10_big_fil_rev_8_21_14_0_10_45_28 TaxID=1974586 RepID=A0A2H0UN69_9BACT|nr:MAG: hypothetical protein COU10_02505 [Candidatus Harrisonbacteria bacterium CG10_big_fil_rev_8_21_14_0_10_45_28]